MAAAMRSEVFRLLKYNSFWNLQVQAVRWKKPPKWRDPKDISWAAPLFEWKQKQKEKEGAKPCEPHMIHMVMRVRSLKGRPYWEKDAMESLGLLEKEKFSPVVHKNIPEVNRLLQSVKHLIRIVPVSFPHGLPQDESDFHHCVLQSDGQLTIKKKIHPLEEQVSEVIDSEKKDVWEMDTDTLKKAAVDVLNGLHLSKEYFPAKYTYRYNQDGKEYRYRGRPEAEKEKDWF